MTSPRRWVILLAGLLFLAGGAAPARPGRPAEQTLDTPFGRAHIQVLTEHMGAGDAIVHCRVTDLQGEWPPEALTLHYQTQGAWRTVHFRRATEPGQGATGAGEMFEAAIPNAGRGARVFYYVQVALAPGQSLQLPANGQNDPFPLTFKGRPSTPLIIAHVVCMMVGLVLLVVAMIGAILFLRNGRSLALHRRSSLIGFVLLFTGGVPLGIAVERQVFGTYWEGWPFGRDVTDTKTGLILLLWLILMLVRGRDLWGKLPATRGPRDRTWAAWLIAITIFTVAMYLIPHENIKF
jgi:hypothetical protein